MKLKRKTFEIYGLTQEEKKCGYPVYLREDKNLCTPVRMVRAGGGITHPIVYLNPVEVFWIKVKNLWSDRKFKIKRYRYDW